MPRIAYVVKDFRDSSLDIIAQANSICRAYRAEGYDLTLRQLYYQFVARGLIENTDRSYKRLGAVVNDARLAGLMDWNYITDRTRNLRDQAHWDSPEAIVDAVAQQYREQRWRNQPYRVEVWIEKDALVGVVERIATELDLPHFSCRGYTSQSEVWSAAQRLLSYRDNGQEPVILHLGDHDPSGIDMTRDITDRLDLFMNGQGPEVRRIALNMDQVRAYNPPPNPAKLTDSRGAGYVAEHGRSSWELDALNPTILTALIRDQVDDLLDQDQWDLDTDAQEHARGLLVRVSERWDDVAAFIDDPDGPGDPAGT